MKSILSASKLLAFGLLLVNIHGPSFAHTTRHAVPASVNSTKLEQTDAALRDLWLGHAFWVRAVVSETLAGNPSAAAAAENAAVSNAKEIAASMQPFYGDAASAKLFELLAGHYGAVKGYLQATVAKSSEKQDSARKAMFDNADALARFLSSANPHLPLDGVRGMLLAHGGHHVQQIQQLEAKQYADEARTWLAMKDHMYAVADTTAAALAKQFPAKFNGDSM